ncbi:MAG: clan AA aspartic protease [Calothrix sp. FI2-JRJ7]|jgi:predicted aspartyl protease|nr:clan AA aspartic protease [Calothrix sp. FI2-JRJ7]
MLDFNRVEHKINKEIGEIRVKVKLTNAIDEGLISRGFLNPTDLHVYETSALIDTSAVRTVIPMHVAQKLGLEIRSEQVAKYADGRPETVEIAEPVLIEIQGRETSESLLVVGDEILIGQIGLETLDFVVDFENHRLIPNPKHPDGSVFRI